MLGMVQDLLDFSRGERRICLDRTSVAALVDDIQEQLGDMLEKQSIDLQRRLAYEEAAQNSSRVTRGPRRVAVLTVACAAAVTFALHSGIILAIGADARFTPLVRAERPDLVITSFFYSTVTVTNRGSGAAGPFHEPAERAQLARCRCTARPCSPAAQHTATQSMVPKLPGKTSVGASGLVTPTTATWTVRGTPNAPSGTIRDAGRNAFGSAT